MAVEIAEIHRHLVLGAGVDVGDHHPAELGGEPEGLVHHVPPADAHGHDHLPGHATPGQLLDRGAGVLHGGERGVGPEPDGPFPLVGHRVDGHDGLGPGQPGALDRRGTDAAHADHHHRVARPDVRGVDRRPQPVTAPHPTGTRCAGVGRVDPDAAGLVDHGVVGEHADQAHDLEVSITDMVPRRPVGLSAPADQHSEVTEVLVTGGAGYATSARRKEGQDDMIAGGQGVHPRAHRLHHTGSLVPADHG